MPKNKIAVRTGIDIGERTVKIIKTNRAGQIIKAATATLPEGLSYMAGDDYAEALTKAIKEATKKAGGIRSGKCVIVVGGPNIIIRRFTWPDIPQSAFALNAEQEITPYLPDETNSFSVHYTVLRRKTVTSNDSETPIVQLEVLVAAISKEMAATCVNAVQKAGFAPIRMDIRENARVKLANSDGIWIEKSPDEQQFSQNKSYAILDVADSLVNLSVFINGLFYANRYFGSHVNVGDPFSEVEDRSEDFESSNADVLASEVASVIDFIHYRERTSQVNSLIVYGDVGRIPDLPQNLSENLDIPILLPPNIVEHDSLYSDKITLKISDYLDIYGALISSGKNSADDLDLKPKKKSKGIFKQFVLPIGSIFILVNLGLAAALYFPYINSLALVSKDDQLNYQLNTLISSFTVSEIEILNITQEVEAMTNMLDESSAFYSSYPSASDVLAVVYDALTPETGISSIDISDGTVSLIGYTTALDRVSNLIVTLRKNPLFQTVRVTQAGEQNNENTAMGFELILILKSGMED